MQEVTYFGKMKVHLRFISAQEYEALGSPVATTSHCFPMRGDEVLFTVNPRGLDIIGGHIDPGENGEQALLREAMEEACIVPRKYHLVGAIEVDNKESKEMAQAKGYPLIGYQLIYAVTEYDELEFNATHECVARQYVKSDDVAKIHHNWLKSHQAALEEAKKTTHVKRPKP